MNKDTVVAISGSMSAILAVWSGIPYIRSIISGRTKPHQLTWLVFTIMNGIILLSQYLKGGRASVLISLVYFIYSFTEFILSLRYGVNNTSRWDRLLFTLSILTIVVWVLTKNPSVAIWLTVLIDIFATTMIMLKIRAQPDSEAAVPWAIASFAYVFSIISLANKPLGVLYVRPIYGLLSDVVTVVAIYYFLNKKGKARKKSASRPKTNTSPVV